MCGVVGLIQERIRSDFGQIAGELLRTLEYRGYDSTGAAIQGEGLEVDLRKGVGAPSVLVHSLGITKLSGQILCGQVRWATFGAVNAVNAQPHVVRCKTYLYGAHNGNVTNCDALKAWLTEKGHTVCSDNDGEMVVHCVEHAFAERLHALEPAKQSDPLLRRALMRAAILEASRQLHGSYAAIIVDPVSRVMWAIKQGSSLYFGLGADSTAGAFRVASSDLSSILKLTRTLLPLTEGEFVEFDATSNQVYALREQPKLPGQPTPVERKTVRSLLRTADTALVAPYTSFMQQEIYAEAETCSNVVRLFDGGSPLARRLAPLWQALPVAQQDHVQQTILALLEASSDMAARAELEQIHHVPSVQKLVATLSADLAHADQQGTPLCSVEQGQLGDMLGLSSSSGQRHSVRFIDALLELGEVAQWQTVVEQLTGHCARAVAAGKRIYILCCGTSFHAAKTAAIFYHEIAGIDVQPLLPGEFRGQSVHALTDGDVVIAVSQSGETKDLIDVLGDVIRSGKDVLRVALVNNLNSTIGQEKAHLVLPLRCGPEIAVAATKSFTNQLAVFYCLALRLGERNGFATAAATQRRKELHQLPKLIEESLQQTDAVLDQAAELLYLVPSLHILATRLLAVAKEGALKVREVVLNHTEGFEASEFKHGPNTILGINTVYGMGQLATALQMAVDIVAQRPDSKDYSPAQWQKHIGGLLQPGPADDERDRLHAALYRDYPLLFVTGPDGRDVDLTISQINTHKIRGAQILVIAEPDARLQATVAKAPADNPNYRSLFIPLPTTGDTLMTAFSASVALQHLALKMSTKKMAYLNSIGLRDHGVHPDVPKNVSKSITVD